jgi:transketolase
MHDNTIINQVRHQLVDLSHQNKVPHLACALSCVDILYALYFHAMTIKPSEPNYAQRDRFLLGKGHAAAALYCMLAQRDFFSPDDVYSLGQDSSAFEEHPGVNSPPGVDNISGSLGHALGLATGMAKASKIKGTKGHFYTLVGDGELNEGTNWEAAMFAPAHRLDNITLIVDFNKLQGTGRSCEIMQLDDLAEKWRAFGWNTLEIDGHDVEQLKAALSSDSSVAGKPKAIVAHTVKGAGISFMQDDNNWHYRIPSLEEVELSAKELGLR